MPNLYVSRHAIQRYQERVRACSEQEARQALSTTTVELAARIGARFVRLATGHRIALEGTTVTTVIPADDYRKQVRRLGLGRFGNEPERAHHRKGGKHD